MITLTPKTLPTLGPSFQSAVGSTSPFIWQSCSFPRKESRREKSTVSLFFADSSFFPPYFFLLFNFYPGSFFFINFFFFFQFVSSQVILHPSPHPLVIFLFSFLCDSDFFFFSFFFFSLNFVIFSSFFLLLFKWKDNLHQHQSINNRHHRHSR